MPPFVPESLHDWVRSHVHHIPQTTVAFCGDLSGAVTLDIGCGDMVADVGLLGVGLERVTGLDLHSNSDVVKRATQIVAQHGLSVPDRSEERLNYVSYDGLLFPFADNSFDFVFSWSAFEHIRDVPAVLNEARRVVKPFGKVFIQVYPWFHTYVGSHLSDFIEEPFFHLTRPPEWVHSRLSEYAHWNPERRRQVRIEMWPEYERLNGYSAKHFMTDVLTAGFVIAKAETYIDPEHAAQAPPNVPLADVISYGTMVLLHPAKMPVLNKKEIFPWQEQLAVAQAAQLKAELELRSARQQMLEIRQLLENEKNLTKKIVNSVSWRVTRPARAMMRFFRPAK